MSGERKLGGLALEMVSVVVAVVLGFAVSNWGESRREQIRARDAVARISLELAANNEEIRKARPYYGILVQQLDSILAVDGDGPFDPLKERPVPAWKGIEPPPLRAASFNVAMATGALEHVEYGTADQIARAYEQIDRFGQLMDDGMQGVLEGTLTDVSDVRLLLYLLWERLGIVSASISEVESLLGGPGA